jgi:gas vesicle protein
MDTVRKVFVSFLVGAAAGAAAGLLFAPEKGTRTRRRLARRAEDLRGDISERWEDNSARMQDFRESAKSTAEKYGKQINKAFAKK